MATKIDGGGYLYSSLESIDLGYPEESSSLSNKDRSIDKALGQVEQNPSLYLRAKWLGGGLTTTRFYHMSSSMERIRQQIPQLSPHSQSAEPLRTRFRAYQIKLTQKAHKEAQVFQQVARDPQRYIGCSTSGLAGVKEKTSKIAVYDLNNKFKQLMGLMVLNKNSGELAELKENFETIKDRVVRRFEEKKSQMPWWKSLALNIQIKRAERLISLAEKEIKKLPRDEYINSVKEKIV